MKQCEDRALQPVSSNATKPPKKGERVPPRPSEPAKEPGRRGQRVPPRPTQPKPVSKPGKGK